MPDIPKKRKLPNIPKLPNSSSTLTPAQRKRFIEKAKKALATFKKFKFLIPPIATGKRKKKLKVKGLLPETLRGLKKEVARQTRIIESLK